MSDTNNFLTADDIVNQLVNQIDSNDFIEDEIQDDENSNSSSKKDAVKCSKRKYKRSDSPKNDNFYEVIIPSMGPDDFRYHFRMSRRCFESIMTRVGSKIRVYSIEKKFLFTIWMLSTRESFGSVCKRFCLSRGSSHQYFWDIIDGLLTLFKQYVHWPSESDFSNIEQGFKPNTGGYVPGIIGAINSCHLFIKKPSRYSIYSNPKKTHSIILQAVCDHQKIFTDVYVGAPGCLHAERVFNNSPLSKLISSLIPGDFHIVGNNYYPQLRNVIVPFIDLGMLTDTEHLFNDCLVKANSTIQQAFQMLLGRFRRLSYLDTSKPEKANKLVCSCIILHNHILMTDLDEDPDTFVQDLPELYMNVDPEGITASDDDSDGLIKKNYLLSLLGFI